MLAASLSESLGWGFLVLCDSQADFQGLPELGRTGFVSTRDATLVVVQHGSDGEVDARLWTGKDDWSERGALRIGVTTIAISSGVVVMGDVVHDKVATAAVEPGTYRLQVNADAIVHATAVDFVLVKPGWRARRAITGWRPWWRGRFLRRT